MKKRHLSLLTSFCGFLVLLQPGCNHTEEERLALNKTPSFKATNRFSSGILKPEIVRVALLPIYISPQHQASAESIEHALYSEFEKTMLFEVSRVPRVALRDTFRKERFNSSGVIPHNLFTWLKYEYGAQAVVFLDITHWEPYRPISIGIRAKLVDLESQQILWAFDTLFDAGNPQMALSARRYYLSENATLSAMYSSDSILLSPTQFTQFAGFQTFQTLPKRVEEKSIEIAETSINTEISSKIEAEISEPPVPVQSETTAVMPVGESLKPEPTAPPEVIDNEGDDESIILDEEVEFVFPNEPEEAFESA